MLRLIWVGAVLAALVLCLGLVTPFDHPERTRVDNALLILGALGILNSLLLVRTRLIPPGAGPRAALASYALLSAAALGVTDFGALRTIEWAIKAVGVALLL